MRSVATVDARAMILPAMAACALCCALLATGIVQVGAFTILVGSVVLRHAREITHPLTWFGPVFWLYSAAYPLLALSGLYAYDVSLQRALALHSSAFAAFALPLYGFRAPLRVDHWNGAACHFRRDVAAAGVLLLLPATAFLIMRLTTLGVATKRELWEAGSQMLSQLAAVLGLLTFALTVLLVASLRVRRPVLPILLLAIAVFVPVLAYAGERDYLLRFVVIFVLVWWDFHRRPKVWSLVLLGGCILLFLPLLQSLKAVALGNQINYQFEVASIIAQEFRVMTQNTWFVLELNVSQMLASPFTSLGMDLQRAFMPQVLGLKAMSTNAWFNEVVLFDVIAGRGFSLVATGYLAGGALGVASLYFLMGWAFRALYFYRSRSYIHLTVYALAAPLFMYVQRGDLSALLGPALRSVLIPAVAFMLAVECARRMVRASHMGAHAANSWIGRPDCDLESVRKPGHQPGALPR